MNATLTRAATLTAVLMGAPAVAQIELVDDLVPGPLSSNPMAMVENRGLLYFLARPGSSVGLYSYFDVDDRATVVKILSPGEPGQPGQFTLTAGKKWRQFMFFTINFSDRSELWYSDGTTEGTQRWDAGAAHEQLATFETSVVFTDDPVAGSGFWHARGKDDVLKIDRILAGLVDYSFYRVPTITDVISSGATAYLVANIDTETGETVRDMLAYWGFGGTLRIMEDGAKDRWPTELTPFKKRVFFSAIGNDGKRELWVADGMRRELFLDLADVARSEVPNPRGSSPRWFTIVRDKMFFWADIPFVNSDGVEAIRMELFATDGTRDGTAHVGDVIPPNSIPVTEGTRVGELFLFSMATPGEGIEYWVSDGTKNGTRLLKDIHPTGSSRPVWPQPAGSRHTWFAAHDGVHGIELWRTDGETTAMVQDLYPGAASTSPENLTHYNGRIYFSAKTQQNGRELFSVDTGAVSIPVGHGFSEDGPEPTLRCDDPVLGSTMKVTVGDMPLGANVALFLGFPGEPLELFPDGVIGLNLLMPVAQSGAWIMHQPVHELGVPIPSRPVLAGATFRAQAGGIAPDGGYLLTNAVDLLVGY